LIILIVLIILNGTTRLGLVIKVINTIKGDLGGTAAHLGLARPADAACALQWRFCSYSSTVAEQ